MVTTSDTFAPTLTIRAEFDNPVSKGPIFFPAPTSPNSLEAILAECTGQRACASKHSQQKIETKNLLPQKLKTKTTRAVYAQPRQCHQAVSTMCENLQIAGKT